MSEIVVSGSGVYKPPYAIGNEELVSSYNTYAKKFNIDNAKAIDADELEPMSLSSVEFIEKASGIKNRYIMGGEGVIDPSKLQADLPEDPHGFRGAPNVVVKMALEAAKGALKEANKSPEDVDLIINAASLPTRMIPSLAVEMQNELGAKGFAFDMQMGCSGATFALAQATNAIKSGMANIALVVNPEYLEPLLNFKNRDSHFIFGSVGTAVILEREYTATSKHQFKIKSTKLFTQYSNNIRAAFGSMLRIDVDNYLNEDFLFQQEGRKVFKELLPLVVNHISKHLEENNFTPFDIRRMWLHQANINMNQFAAKKILGHNPSQDESPIILDEYGNTGGAGVVIAYHKYHRDMKSGDLGLMSSFGAGYSIGSMIMEKI
ncbi:MAG: beta-ketoacyl-ACP synthase III [Sphingomonadales bacterium]|jgi:beta-ketodecanoyl-[acyl-carrier-protein] synthase